MKILHWDWRLFAPMLSHQTWLKMKLTVFILLVTFLQVNAEGFAQDNITLSLKNVTLERAFAEIKARSAYSFVYAENLLLEKVKVSIDVKDASINEVLDSCLKGQPLTYKIVNRIIVINTKNEIRELKQNDDTHLFVKEIEGKVVTKDGEALGGASVVLVSTGKGIITNSNGTFRLTDVKDNDRLKVSFVGYKPKLVSIENKASYTIVLELADNELDDVLIQGYGVTSRRLATGNISRINSQEIEKHPIVNPIRILQGLIPGAVVTNGSGTSSSSVKIEIRGRNTINPLMVSEPLYIVDGVPMTILNVSGDKVQSIVGGTTLSQGTIQSGIPSSAGIGQSPFLGINPSDIESIEVLKDADATAIYGSRASNGVILITTKKGKAGKTHSEVTAYTGYSQVPRYYKLLNTKEYVLMRKEALANDGLPIDAQTAPDLVTWDTARYTDWQKYIWGGTGRRTSLQANLSGGDTRTSFRVSAGCDYDRDIVTQSGGNYRGSFSFNLNHKSLNQKFGFTWAAVYSVSKINPTNLPGSVLLPPNAPAIFDENGNLNYSGWGPNGQFPFGSLFESYVSKTNFLNSNIGLSYEIFKGLVISSNLGYNNSQNEQLNIIPISSQNPTLNPTGTMQIGQTIFKNIIVEPKIEYSTFINKGKLSVLVGGTAQTNKTDGTFISGLNYTNDLLLSSINSAPNKNSSKNYGQYKYAGLFGRLNFIWENKYILNLNARRDGSSRFGQGRQFGNFVSAGAAWIFSEEKFVKKFSFLSFGKLRASYGITGSDQIGDYAYLSLWQFGGIPGSSGTYNSNIPLIPIGFSDSLLQWEVNKKIEVGINLGFLKDRISLEVSFYQNRCNNQLVAFPTPAFTGFSAVSSNTPANVQNRGMEYVLNTKIVDHKNFKWEMRSSIAINKNKLIDYPNLSQSPYKYRFVIGQPLNIGLFMHYAGIDPQTGTYLFEDIDHNGNINDLDLYPRLLAPKFDGGVTNTFTYRNWNLSAFFYVRKQMGNNILASANYAGSMSNQAIEVLGRWQKPGDITTVGKFTSIGSLNDNYYYNFSDARITDASFVRLQNLYLSYQFGSKMATKAGIASLKLYVQGENLFVLTKYKGIDPEVQLLSAMPFPRIVTFGISCGL